MLTLTKAKLPKISSLRNIEYYDFQETLDKLWHEYLLDDCAIIDTDEERELTKKAAEFSFAKRMLIFRLTRLLLKLRTQEQLWQVSAATFSATPQRSFPLSVLPAQREKLLLRIW